MVAFFHCNNALVSGAAQVNKVCFDIALNSLKRHSDIVRRPGGAGGAGVRGAGGGESTTRIDPSGPHASIQEKGGVDRMPLSKSPEWTKKSRWTTRILRAVHRGLFFFLSRPPTSSRQNRPRNFSGEVAPSRRSFFGANTSRHPRPFSVCLSRVPNTPPPPPPRPPPPPLLRVPPEEEEESV